MKTTWNHKLSRRERQVMDILLSIGEACATDIRQRLPEAPSYSAVRALLCVMEKKGVLTHKIDGPRYVYKPTIAPEKARQSILQQVLQNLFHGSREQLVAALLDPNTDKISRAEFDRLAAQIEEARKAGR